MPVVRPPITGSLALDSWTNQVTRHINTDLGSTSGSVEVASGAAGTPGVDGAPAPHYAETTLFTDPAVGSLPSAPTATMTWTTGALSSVTAGWSQTPPTVDPTSTDNVYSSKLIFIDTIAPFATTTVTGSTPVKSFELSNLDSIGTDIIFVNSLADLPVAVSGVITLVAGKTYFFTADVDLVGDRLETGGVVCIIGTSSETASITSTGLTSGVPLLTSRYTIPVRFITFKDVHTGIYVDDNSGANAPVAIDWFGVNFLNVTVVGEVGTVDNFVYDTGAFLGSQGLTFSGTIGTVGLANSLFQGDGSTASIIEITAAAVITRRFRVIYSSVVAFALTTGITVSASATIPDEGFILDTLNFSGGSTYVVGILYSDNRARWTECRGINNSASLSQYYMTVNATATTIAAAATAVKVAGTTTSAAITQKFTNTSNRATYTGAISSEFKISAVFSANSGNNHEVGTYIAKNGTVLPESFILITTNAGGRAEAGVTQAIVTLVDTDYIEIFVTNESSIRDVTVTELNVIVEALK